jgi:hypothetical protein
MYCSRDIQTSAYILHLLILEMLDSLFRTANELARRKLALDGHPNNISKQSRSMKAIKRLRTVNTAPKTLIAGSPDKRETKLDVAVTQTS